MSEYRNYDDDFIYDSSNYGKHVSAMTGEQLHSKSDIAAELAYRDDLIEQLQQRAGELESENQAMVAHIEVMADEITGIINDSVGLAGYHMNGEIASWQEFDIEDILEQSPQTSLAEVRAKQAEESFVAGYKAAWLNHVETSEPEPPSDWVKSGSTEHATKIRSNGKDIERWT